MAGDEVIVVYPTGLTNLQCSSLVQQLTERFYGFVSLKVFRGKWVTKVSHLVRLLTRIKFVILGEINRFLTSEMG